MDVGALMLKSIFNYLSLKLDWACCKTLVDIVNLILKQLFPKLPNQYKSGCYILLNFSTFGTELWQFWSGMEMKMQGKFWKEISLLMHWIQKWFCVTTGLNWWFSEMTKVDSIARDDGWVVGTIWRSEW